MFAVILIGLGIGMIGVLVNVIILAYLVIGGQLGWLPGEGI